MYDKLFIILELYGKIILKKDWIWLKGQQYIQKDVQNKQINNRF